MELDQTLKDMYPYIKREKELQYKRKYNQLPKVKEAKRKWRQSKHGKEYMHKYSTSSEYREKQNNYYHSYKGQEYYTKYKQSQEYKNVLLRWQQSQKYKENTIKYNKSIEHKKSVYRYRQSIKYQETRQKYGQTHKCKETKHKYYQSPKGRIKSLNARYKRRSLKKNNNVNNDAEKYIELLTSKKRKKCYWCGKYIKKGELYHIDHIIPLSRGGEHSQNNLVISCPTCNLSKHTMYPWEYQKYRLIRKKIINNKFKIDNNVVQATIF